MGIVMSHIVTSCQYRVYRCMHISYDLITLFVRSNDKIAAILVSVRESTNGLLRQRNMIFIIKNDKKPIENQLEISVCFE